MRILDSDEATAEFGEADGTEKRKLGRGFLLGFTDHWRYSLLGNANNVNESRHIGEHDHWTPATMPQSLLTTYSVATDLDYLSVAKKLANNFHADYTSTETESEMRSRYEQFLEGSKPVSTMNNHDKKENYHLKLVNSFETRKPAYFSSKTHFDYDKWNGSGKSLFKGKFIARLESFDLLHQVSSVQYHVNAQGRTETWHRSLPNYIMFHLQWMFSKNPKKK